MRLSHRTVPRRRAITCRFSSSRSHASDSFQNLIQIRNGTFYREHPSSVSSPSSNPAYFPDLNYTLPATPVSDVGKPIRKTQHWAVVGANDTTTFLDVLRGSMLCIPAKARTYPYLSSDEIAQKDPRLRIPSRAIQYVGFNAKNGGLSSSSGVQGAYLSARYESRREETDWTVLQYLKGDTELNPSEQLSQVLKDDDPLLQQVIRDLRLQKLASMPVSNLSNGQTRRSRIAKALLSRPELLLLDEPFMGLDPPTLVSLSPMLKELAYRSSPLLILALRPQDPIPDWISHLVILGANRGVPLMGEKDQILFSLRRWCDLNQNLKGNGEGATWLRSMREIHGEPLEGVGDALTEKGIKSYETYDRAKIETDKYFTGMRVRSEVLDSNRADGWEEAMNKNAAERTTEDWWTLTSALPSGLKTEAVISQKSTSDSQSSAASNSTSTIPSQGEPLIEISSLVLKYGTKTILGHPPAQSGFDKQGLNLTIRRGTRLALLGPNGSGKTTLLSLLTSDHPQSYSLPIKFFGRDRLPTKGKPGLSLWEIQSRIGHSSPEVHAFFPKTFTIRRVLESAYAETFGSKPDLDEKKIERIDRVLKWWEPELKQSMRSSTSDSDLSWSTDRDNSTFNILPFGTQRLLLLLRAALPSPCILVLDEAFSGLSSQTRDKALSFLEHGERFIVNKGQKVKNEEFIEGKSIAGLTDQQALIVVSHVREEVPGCVDEWVRLPSEEEAESGMGVRIGKVEGNKEIRGVEGWNSVWGL